MVPGGKSYVVIKSSNDKIPSQTVECLPGWKVKDLKDHISKHHPARPNASSQRLIHAGKLLKDDSPLCNIYSQAGDPQTIHLVCPNPKPLAPADVSYNRIDYVWCDISSEQMQKYQQAYYQYLQTFYMENLTGNQTNHCVQGYYWPYAFGTGSFSFANTFLCAPQTCNPPNQETSNTSSNNPQPWIQRAQMLLSRWGIPNANQRRQEAAEVVPIEDAANEQRAGLGEPQVAQQVIMFDNAMRNNIRPDEEGEGMGNMDIVDRFYMLFRLCLFVGLCFAYSSLDKAIIVFSVAAYVYLYNIYRRYAVVERVVQARQPQQDLQVEQGSSSHRGSEHAESDNQQNHVSQESTSSESRLRTDLPFEQEPRLTRITTNLRSVANTSYQFFSALISSIIPEQQPPLHLD